MNAQDLMVGDLVRVSKDVCIEKGAIVRVHAIDGDNNFPEKGLKGCVTCVRINDPDRMSGGVWAEYLEPIPLTAEILRKNEFEYGIFPEYKSNHIDTQTELKITVHSGTDTVFIAIDEPNFNLVNDCVLYVHELQHDLKRARIKKEVVL